MRTYHHIWLRVRLTAFLKFAIGIIDRTRHPTLLAWRHRWPHHSLGVLLVCCFVLHRHAAIHRAIEVDVVDKSSECEDPTRFGPDRVSRRSLVKPRFVISRESITGAAYDLRGGNLLPSLSKLLYAQRSTRSPDDQPRAARRLTARFCISLTRKVCVGTSVALMQRIPAITIPI